MSHTELEQPRDRSESSMGGNMKVGAMVRRGASMAMVCTILTVIGGCRNPATRFEIHDYQKGEAPRRYFQDFDECYYSTNPAGNLDIVFRRRNVTRNSPPRRLAQVVHIKTFWTPIPGSTFAEAKMINAGVSYQIYTEPTAASFEGAGFVSFKADPRRRVLTGRLESGQLEPMRTVGPVDELFDRALIIGRFQAVEDRARVVQILNDMSRKLGPMPNFTPPQTDRSVL